MRSAKTFPNTLLLDQLKGIRFSGESVSGIVMPMSEIAAEQAADT